VGSVVRILIAFLPSQTKKLLKFISKNNSLGSNFFSHVKYFHNLPLLKRHKFLYQRSSCREYGGIAFSSIFFVDLKNIFNVGRKYLLFLIQISKLLYSCFQKKNFSLTFHVCDINTNLFLIVYISILNQSGFDGYAISRAKYWEKSFAKTIIDEFGSIISVRYFPILGNLI
jgi:hypothetical protein